MTLCVPEVYWPGLVFWSIATPFIAYLAFTDALDVFFCGAQGQYPEADLDIRQVVYDQTPRLSNIRYEEEYDLRPSDPMLVCAIFTPITVKKSCVKDPEIEAAYHKWEEETRT